MKRATIQAIHDRRKTTDQNSQTLAGMLEATIHTGFHDPHKFVYEILQNADDAGANVIRFSLGQDYLLVTYDGSDSSSESEVLFKKADVERICDVSTHDSAEQNSKVHNLNKIGYKGIGFKSVFCVSEKVTVISNGYQFCFDKKAWNTPGFKHPWQIIPIPVEEGELLSENISNAQVNILMQALIVPVAEIKFEIEKICRNHESILFLENIQHVRFVYQKNILVLEKEKPKQKQDYIIQEIVCSDGVSDHIRKWYCYTEKAIPIPDVERTQLNKLSSAECPQKIKNAIDIKIVFAAEIDLKETHLIPTDKSKLYCGLPTAVISGFYYSVNANFLLNQDRTLILNNAWNAFLLEQIGYLQFKWFARLASQPDYKTSVLHLMSPKEHVLSDYPMIATRYVTAFDHGIENTPFIPSISGALLKVPECIIDMTHFFDEFHRYIKDPNLLSETQEWRLTFPRLDEKSLCALQQLLGNEPKNLYTISHLLNKIENYVEQIKKNKALLTDIVYFFIHMQKMSDSDLASLRKKAIFLTEENLFCSADNGFLPPKSLDKKYHAIPSQYNLNMVQTFYVISEETKINLKNKFHLAPLTLIDFVKKFVLPLILLDEKEENLVLRNNTIDLLRLIYDAFFSKKKAFSQEDLGILNQFPVYCMEGNKLMRIEDSYLFDEHHNIPKKFILSTRYYQIKEGDTRPPSSDWKAFLQKMGINLQVQLECHEKVAFGTLRKSFGRYSSCFEEYVDDIVSKNVEKLPGQGAKFHPSNPSFESALEKKPDIAKFLYFVSFVSMPRILALTRGTQSQIDLLWLAIYKDFPTFSQLCQYSAGKKTTALPEHFLIYCIKKYPLVKVYGHPAKYKRTVDLIYSPAFNDVINTILPTPDLPEYIRFSEEQAKLLGFRCLPTMEECLKILTNILEKKPFCAEKIKKIYTLIITVSDQLSPETMNEWKKNNKLPTLSGELCYADSISVFDGHGLAPEPLGKWLSDYGLDKIELSKLADKLYLEKFSNDSNCYKVLSENPIEDRTVINALKDEILSHFPMLMLIQSYGYPTGEAKNFMRKTLDEFYKIKFVRCSAPIRISDKERHAYINENTLYFYVHPGSIYANIRSIRDTRIRDLVETLGNFLNFDSKTIDEFEVMLLKQYTKREMSASHKALHEELMAICDEYKELHPVLLSEGSDSIDVDFAEKALKKLRIDDKEPEVAKKICSSPPEERKDLDIDDLEGLLDFTEPVGAPTQPKLNLTTPKDTKKKKFRTPITTPDDAGQKGAAVDDKEKKYIGRLGEQRAYDELKNHYIQKYCNAHKNARIDEYEDGDDYTKRGFHISGFDKAGKEVKLDVIWYNKGVDPSKDLMRDHDIKIFKNGVKRYIEVKATKSRDSSIITLSGSEQKRMFDARHRYRIFRVYDVDSDKDYFIHKIKDPAELISQQQVKIESIKLSYKIESEIEENFYSRQSNGSRFFKIVPTQSKAIESEAEAGKSKKMGK